MTPPRVWLSWSSGKDSTYALHTLRSAGEVEVVGLLTTLNSTADRVAMHAVRRELLLAQAGALGLPVHPIELPWPCPNGVYEELMADALQAARGAGVEGVAFGDLYLEDVRAYREEAMSGTGLRPLFPLWHLPTAQLARDMVAGGVRAILTCVDPRQIPAEFAGRWYDEALLADLPSSVDPCGENGEFHTFVVDGPGFAAPLDVRIGETVERDGFVFTDVLPA